MHIWKEDIKENHIVVFTGIIHSPAVQKVVIPTKYEGFR